MKTSESIREAVDKYLAVDGEEFKNKGLCVTFWFVPEAWNLLQLIRQDDAGSVFVPEWLIDGDPTEESQAIRFMLAEFMALYFEDLGD